MSLLREPESIVGENKVKIKGKMDAREEV